MSSTTAVIARPSLSTTIRSYLTVTKPWIVLLLLVTTVPSMMLAADGWPPLGTVLATLLGGTLSAAGANAVNCWYDRDIDARLLRTRHRPTVTGAVPASKVLALGVILGVPAFLWLLVTTTPLAAVLAAGGYLFYVFIYTVWLKRRTPQNIVIGGAAGAFPPLVGWAAVTGSLSWAAFVLFLVIFLWTPPHFWALALRLKDDYARAGIPMLPVVAGERETRRQILVYALLTVLVSLVLPLVSEAGTAYVIAAMVAGAGLIWHAYRLWRAGENVLPMSLYKYSLLYVAQAFAGLVVDVGLS